MSAADFDPIRRVQSHPREMLTPAQQLRQALDTPVMPLIGMVALFLACFGNSVNLATDKDEVAIDGQVLVKLGVLAVCGLYGAYGFLTEPKVRRLILTLPVIWVAIICGLYFVAVFSSIMPSESFASAVSIVCVLLMTVTCLVQLGVRTVINTVFLAVSAFVLLSWVTFFVAPQIGVFAEPLPDGQFAVRMSGLSHPNTLGQFSGLLIVLGCILSVRYRLMTKWRMAIMLLAAGALIGSLSRTALLASILSVALIYRRQILKPQNFIYLVLLAFLGCIGLMVLVTSGELGDVIESRSGQANQYSTSSLPVHFHAIFHQHDQSR